MAKERKPESEYQEDDERHEVDELADAESEEEEEEPEFEQPFCPRCGWHNTRPSHTSTPIDVPFSGSIGPCAPESQAR